MSTRVTNGIGLRKEMEARTPPIGLNASGSYVLRSFDREEYDRVHRVDFGRMLFSEEDFVVVARGPQGSLARFAKLSEDRLYARYLGGKFVSVALVNGAVFTKAEFVRSLAGNATLSVVRGQDSRSFLGVLHGDMAKKYKTLVYPVDAGFLFLDLEENPPGHAMHMKVRVVATDPPEGAAVRSSLLERFQ